MKQQQNGGTLCFGEKKKKAAASAGNIPVTAPEQNEAKNPGIIASSPSAPDEGKEVKSVMLRYEEELAKIGPIPDGEDDIDIDGIPKILEKAFYPSDGENHFARIWVISVKNCGEKGQLLDKKYYRCVKNKDDDFEPLYDLYKFLKNVLNESPRVSLQSKAAGGSVATGGGGLTASYQTRDAVPFELWYNFDENWGDDVLFHTKTDAQGRLMLQALRLVFEDFLGFSLRVSIQPNNCYWFWRNVTFTKADAQPADDCMLQ